jgi:predicted NBD/HSP70 family sugar kinase
MLRCDGEARTRWFGKIAGRQRGAEGDYAVRARTRAPSFKATTYGDKGAVGIVRRSGRLIGETLATLVSVLNPSLIAIGGGVAYAASHTLLAEIRSAVYRRSLPLATRNLPIDLSELEDAAGVVGASVLATEGVLEVAS